MILREALQNHFFMTGMKDAQLNDYVSWTMLTRSSSLTCSLILLSVTRLASLNLDVHRFGILSLLHWCLLLALSRLLVSCTPQ